jgi:hypothetical protein
MKTPGGTSCGSPGVDVIAASAIATAPPGVDNLGIERDPVKQVVHHCRWIWGELSTPFPLQAQPNAQSGR